MPVTRIDELERQVQNLVSKGYPALAGLSEPAFDALFEPLRATCRKLAPPEDSSDRRVPALWISQGRPKLGWCWAGNPHTWLGSASCGGRS